MTNPNPAPYEDASNGVNNGLSPEPASKFGIDAGTYLCAKCGGPRSPLSANLCRSCYATKPVAAREPPWGWATKAFAKGDRVTFSENGNLTFPKKVVRTGTILGESSSLPDCWRIRWDGPTRQAESFHQSFLAKLEPA